MKRRRASDIEDQLELYNGKIKVPRQTRRSLIFDDLCNFFDGIYVGSRFMGFIIPDGNTKKLDALIGKITGVKDLKVDDFLKTSWEDHERVLNHRILRIVLNLDLYNEHFAITQKYDKTYGVDPETLRKNMEKESMTEQDLVGDLVRGNKFNVILPLYLKEIVRKPWDWGPEVMTSINEYFRTGDRRHVDYGNRDLCYKLLEGPLKDMGLARSCINLDHPPLPTKIFRASGTPNFKTRRRVYFPIMTFHEIDMFDREGLDNKLDRGNIKHHVIENYETLGQGTLLVNVSGGPNYIPNSDSLYDFKTLSRDIKSVVLIFRNQGEMKNFTLMDHPFIGGLKRTSAIFRYIIPPNRLDSVVCYTHVRQFSNS